MNRNELHILWKTTNTISKLLHSKQLTTKNEDKLCQIQQALLELIPAKYFYRKTVNQIKNKTVYPLNPKADYKAFYDPLTKECWFLDVPEEKAERIATHEAIHQTLNEHINWKACSEYHAVKNFVEN
jgi:hypothetical protein